MSDTRHFHVPAREMLLDTPTPCPFLPTLQLLGLAATSDGQHHLIVRLTGAPDTGAQRVYLGPTSEDVQRRAAIITLALANHRNPDATIIAEPVGMWLIATWEATITEVAKAIMGDSLTGL